MKILHDGDGLRVRVDTLDYREYMTEVPSAYEWGSPVKWEPLLRVEYSGEIVLQVGDDLLGGLEFGRFPEDTYGELSSALDDYWRAEHSERVAPEAWEIRVVFCGRGIVARPLNSRDVPVGGVDRKKMAERMGC